MNDNFVLKSSIHDIGITNDIDIFNDFTKHKYSGGGVILKADGTYGPNITITAQSITDTTASVRIGIDWCDIGV